MKKRILSLICVLALCLGLLPVTALAVGEDAPGTLWVGQTQITASDYWKTNDDGTLTTEGAGNDNYNVHYDGNGTLTLNNANIQGGNDSQNPQPQDYGIYAAPTGNQSVSLTIELIGENTITGYYGIYVNAEMSANSYGIDASLTITGENNGSLKVSGSYHGIYVKSGTGDASLNINDASVVASSSSSYSGYAGVYVQSSIRATSSPQLSLKVNGGSLTTSGTGNSDGILFYVGQSQATGATTSLTVSDNAIVRANGGIKASRVDEPTPSGTGIVFDGKEGTVYGDVTLDESLTINQGETLTVPDGSSLTSKDKLTNNGTINVEDGGNLNGGTTLTTPTISTQPTGQTVTEGNPATFAVTASDVQSYQWQQRTNSGSDWTNISENATSSTYTISNTTTDMSGYQYRCVVTSASGVSITSAAATLTVEAYTPPTTYTISADASPAEGGSVTVNNNGISASVTAGDEVTLTATANSGYRFVGWMEGDQTVSTDTTYAFQASSNRSLTAKFEKVYTVTVNASGGGTATGGGSYAEGETVTLSAQANQGYRFTGWTSSNGGTFADASSESTTFTMPAGDVTVTAGFTRISSGSTTPTKTPSQQAVDKIESAKDGSTVEIKLSTGSTKLDKEVFEELAGRDVTLEISLPGGVLWTVNGLDIPEDTRLHDLDLDVDLGDSDIPATVLNAVTGEIGAVQLSLAHDGEFGFTMTLSAPLGKTNAGYWANLYWYNERTEELEFQQAARIARDGTAEFDLDHASDYAIVIDDRSHEPVDLPFNDVPESYWAYDAIQYVYGEGLMAGTSGSTFSPESTTTRGQIVTILWRLSGSPVVNYLMDFDDVDPAAYYAEAIRWATSEGIAGGYGGGVFGPDDPITREQLAVMLHRYAQHEGYDVSIGEDTNILSYADALEISEYAIPAMQWACGAGILEGDAGHLYPQGNATRAQIATMLMRFCENYVTW